MIEKIGKILKRSEKMEREEKTKSEEKKKASDGYGVPVKCDSCDHEFYLNPRTWLREYNIIGQPFQQPFQYPPGCPKCGGVEISYVLALYVEMEGFESILREAFQGCESAEIIHCSGGTVQP